VQISGGGQQGGKHTHTRLGYDDATVRSAVPTTYEDGSTVQYLLLYTNADGTG